MPAIATKKPLSPEERRLLVIALQEAQARGLQLPKEAQDIVNKTMEEWPVGPNGYFLRNDGKLYEPSSEQEGFIKSKARMALFYGSRGSGKSASGSQKALAKLKEGLSGAVMNPDF
jgi:hypothetical protein